MEDLLDWLERRRVAVQTKEVKAYSPKLAASRAVNRRRNHDHTKD